MSVSPPDVRAIAWHVAARRETGAGVPLDPDQDEHAIDGIAGTGLVLSTPRGPLHIEIRCARRLTMLGPER
jgi:hypothetical protein